MLDEIAKVQRGESLEDLMQSRTSREKSLEGLVKTTSKASSGGDSSLEELLKSVSKRSKGQSQAEHSKK